MTRAANLTKEEVTNGLQRELTRLEKSTNDLMKNLTIDYNFDGCTDLVAFVIKGTNEQGKFWSYVSPFVFSSTEDAYHAACIEISGE